MTKRVLLYFALLLWFVVPVTAQPTIFIENASVDPGQNITADIKVSGFSDIVSMQFSVNWDSTFFQFDSLAIKDTGVLPDYSSSNFNTNFGNSGRLVISWYDQQLHGVSLTDNTSIFTIHYKVLGNSGTDSDIAITDMPTSIEVSDANSNVLEVSVENGTVTVLDPNSIDDLLIQSNPAFTLYQNEPNPFDNQTIIKFDVYEPSDFILEVYDSKGGLIHTENAHFFEGNQSITLDQEIFPAIGAYFYKLKTKDYFITNRMILVRK